MVHPPNDPVHSVVAIDVGATNIEIVQFSPQLDVLNRMTTPARCQDFGPYLSLDVDAVLTFACQTIRDFDRVVPVDAIVPCTHGSAVALIDDAGDLVFEIMSYLARVPDDIAAAYARIEPPYDEVFAPTNPGALTVARQLFWQQRLDPKRFARTRQILPYAQYLAFRLSGVATSEVTSLGAQTHLWAHQTSGFSRLANDQGWADLIAPRTAAGDVIGQASGLALNGQGAVLCGIHDSSASFLQFADHEPLVLLSTGTWIIAFDSGASLNTLDQTRDQVANVRLDGTPIACARFMGGAEYALVAGPDNAARATLDSVAACIAAKDMALPSFTDSGGPVPGTGGQGRFARKGARSDLTRASLATLYTAMMTAFALDQLGQTRRVVVDGVFARNDIFMALLRALLPERDVFKVHGPAGSARGAAILALPSSGSQIDLAQAPQLPIVGVQDYFAAWRAAALNRERTSP